jgi:hypothetical protein
MRLQCAGDVASRTIAAQWRTSTRSKRLFVTWQALVRQEALVGWSVHQGAAFLAGYVTCGSYNHGDCIFGSAIAFMRSCEPFYKLDHARYMRDGRTVSGSFERGYLSGTLPKLDMVTVNELLCFQDGHVVIRAIKRKRFLKPTI